MKNNNKGVIILLIIIILILATLFILFATSAIVFNASSKNNHSENTTTNNQEHSNVTNKENNNSNQENDKKNTNWVEYLENCHILEAKISRIRSKDLGDKENINKTADISIQDLKEILSNIENTNLTKKYSLGMGGPERDTLVISYEYNENTYKFEIINGYIILDNSNKELKQLFESNNYQEDNIEYKNQEGSFSYFKINNYSDNFFDKYF